MTSTISDGTHEILAMELVSSPATVAAPIDRSDAPNASPVSAPVTTLTDEADYLTGAKLWLAMLSVAGVLVLTCIDMNIVATAIPSITNDFHSVADVGWYASAFRLSLCAFQFVFGRAYTLFSVKRVFLLSNVVFIIGSLLCATAASSDMLVAARAVAGLGSAGLTSGCFIIVAQSVPLRRRPLLLGLLGGVQGLATLAAPLLGGVLTQAPALGWRWCFYINPPLGALTAALTMYCLASRPLPPDVASLTPRQKLRRLDLPSNLLFLPALTSLFLALSWAGTKYPWRSGRVIGLLLVFGLLLAVFVYNQFHRVDQEAALPPRILRHRSVWAGFLFILCVNSTGNVLEHYLPTYYQTVRGYSPAKSGFLMFPIVVGATIGALVHGAGTTASGHYAPFMLLASVCMPIAAGLVTTFGISTALLQLILCTGLAGFAYGVGFSGPQNAVQTVLPAADVPLGLSIMLFAQSFGPAVAVAVAQVLFTNQLWENLHGLLPDLSRASMESSSLVELVMTAAPGNATDVLLGIDKSLSQTWYLVVGLACTTLVGSLSIEWRSVKAKSA